MKNKIVVFLVLLIALSTSFTRAQTPFPVGFFPKPIATITGTQSICAGQSAQITITITGGSIWGMVWNDGTTQHTVTNITTSPYILTLVNPTQTTAYWVDSVWNEYGCSSVGNGVALVTVNPLPQIFNISTTNTHFCQGGAGASLTISGSEVGKSYQIKNGLINVGAPQIGTGAILSFSGITVSGVPLTVVATNLSTGCTSLMNGAIQFIMDPLPVAAGTITGITTLCEGQVVTYTIPTITYATTYLWTVPNGTIISGQGTPSITVIGSIPVTTNISVFGQNTCGVGQPASLSVTVNPKPVATITSNPSNATICTGQSLYLASNGGTSATWYPGGISGLTYTPTPTFNTTYTSVVSNVYGCSDTATINVTVSPLPTVTVNTTPFGGNICNGTSATMTASGSTATYLWNDNFVGSVHTVTPGTTTTYTVTGTNSFGCTASASATITVNPLPTATITPSSATICIGQSASFTAAGGVNYLWSNSMTTPSISVTPTTSTTYAVTVTNAFGCTAIANVAVNVNPLPTAAITPTAPSICQGATANLTASGGGTYLWSTGATTASIAVTPSTTTMYSVTVTSISGCVAIANATVTVNPLPLSAGTVSGLISICQNGTATYSTTTIANASTYVWAVPNGATIVSGQGTTQINVTFNGSTSGTISVFGQNACGGGLPSSLSVTVNVAPSLNPTANPTDICIGMSTTLTASGTGNSFLWNTGAITQAITVSPIANTTYYVTATGSNGCTTTSNVSVTVHALPNASIIGLPNAVCTDQNTVALVGSPTGGTFSGFAVGGNLFYPPVAGPGTVTITYTVTDGYGCVGNAVDYITVNPVPVVSFNSPPGPINVGTPAFDMMQFVYPPNGTFTGPGMIGSMFDPATAGQGTHTITYMYTNPVTGCSSGQTQYIPVGSVGIDEVSVAANAITIFPNPTTTELHLTGIDTKTIRSLNIINLLGQVVYTTTINADNMIINVSGLATGSYFIRFIDADGIFISKKIMKSE